ncbi:MAG: hypothetical protein RI894_108 [Bacteroidota bacterium]|jgi:hypothetical protein
MIDIEDITQNNYYKVSNMGQPILQQSKTAFNHKNDAFLSNLQQRIATQPTHLGTFQAFLAFCESVK